MQRNLGWSRKFELSKDLRIGVLCGGSSSERAISLLSGHAVHKAIQKLGFSSTLIDPSKQKMGDRTLDKVDLAFIALHGQGGEDGSVQSQLEERGLPFTGSDSGASWIAFNKKLSKRFFKHHKIPTPKHIFINRENWKRKLSKVKFPVFIKPICEGSSVGVFWTESFTKSVSKVREALRVYEELLVEKKIIGREFTVGILGDQALPVIELIPKGSFYDYQAKYTRGMTEYIVPAKISKNQALSLQRIALRVHRFLRLQDFSRVDIMMDLRGRPYVLEANSVPGLMGLSLLPKAARAAGISFEALCYRLVSWALLRYLHKGREGDPLEYGKTQTKKKAEV